MQLVRSFLQQTIEFARGRRILSCLPAASLQYFCSGAAILAIFSLPAFADALFDVESFLQESRKEISQGSYTEAENHLRQALSLSVHSIGGMSPVTGKVCRQLTAFMMDRGRYGEAEYYAQRALVIASGYSVAVQDSEGDFQNTRQFVSDVIQNPDHLVGSQDVVSALSALAELRRREGNYKDAERMLKRCVQIYQDGMQKTGNPLNYIANSFQLLVEHERKLSEILLKEGNVLEAETTLKSLVETVRKEKGPSPELAEALSYLSAFYRSQNQTLEAEAAESEVKELRGMFH
jgi:tetratricopeptide (TPR) repeat protein